MPVAEVVLAPGDDERADQTLFAQAGLFAVGAGLVALLASCGITPDAVAGHSVGEVTAAYAAGVLSLEDACTLVAARARLMQALPGGGAMTAIAATEAEVAEALHDVAGVSVAAVNGPSSVVISGDAGAVESVAEVFRDQGRRVRRLRVSHAFHSHRMDPVLDELGQAAARLTYASPRVPWACALTGDLVTGPGPGYWPRQAREPVRFAGAVAALAGQEISVFVEIGPDGTLSALGPGALGEDAGAVFIPVLRPGQPALGTVAAALGRAHVHGVVVDWAAVLPRGRRVPLPTYAFQHQRYWPPPPPPGQAAGAVPAGPEAGHPLLAAGVELAGGQGHLLAGRLSLRSHPWLADHAVAGTVLLPGTAFVEMAIKAGDAVWLRPDRGTDAGGTAAPATRRRGPAPGTHRQRRRQRPAGHRDLLTSRRLGYRLGAACRRPAGPGRPARRRPGRDVRGLASRGGGASRYPAPTGATSSLETRR